MTEGIPSLGAEHLRNDGNINWNPQEMKYISPSFFKTLKAGILQEGDVLVVKDGATTGKICYVSYLPSCAAINEHVFLLRTKASLHSKFLFYYLQSRVGNNRIMEYYHGATVGGIGKNIINIEIPFPPLDEQRKIAAVLDKVSDLIAKRRRQLDLLNQLVKSRFVEMFGGIKYIKRPIRELVDCKIVSARKKYGSDEKIHYIDISSIDNKANVITGTTEYVMADAPSRAQQCIEYGDILISTVRPNLRNIARNMYSGDRYVASSGFCILRAKNCDVQFLLCAVLADDFTNAMIEKTTGANYPAIKDSDVLEYHIPVPPIDLQNQFADFAEQTDKSKLAVRKSLEKLETLKKALMQQYFG